MEIIDQTITENFAMYHGDCVEVIKGIPDNSIHYSIFSPPFASLFTYSNSDRDMGNCKTDEEFNIHFSFLVNDLYRVIMNGRLVSVHCMNIPSMKERDGLVPKWIGGFGLLCAMAVVIIYFYNNKKQRNNEKKNIS